MDWLASATRLPLWQDRAIARYQDAKMTEIPGRRDMAFEAARWEMGHAAAGDLPARFNT